jgi:hypothetical protein
MTNLANMVASVKPAAIQPAILVALLPERIADQV